METIAGFFVFLIGLAVGSFLNVLSFRYNPEQGLFDFKKIRGRSKCLSCLNTLRWHDLIPLLSFIILRCRCRSCRAAISWQYPIVELAAGFATLIVFLKFSGVHLAIWFLVSYLLILLAAVDWRLKIIPDEANIGIAALGIARLLFSETGGEFPVLGSSTVGHYALLLGFSGNVWVNHLVAVLVAFLIFGTVILVTRGRGMGLGDLKLSVAAGILLGHPGLLFASMIAFILGSVWGLLLMALRRETLKSAIPFGPWIVIGIFIVAFFGRDIMDGYFAIIDALV